MTTAIRLNALMQQLSTLVGGLDAASAQLPIDQPLRVSGCAVLMPIVDVLTQQATTLMTLVVDKNDLDIVVDDSPIVWEPTADKPATQYIDALAGIVQVVFDCEEQIELLGVMAQTAPETASFAFGHELAVFGTALELLRIRTATLRRFV